MEKMRFVIVGSGWRSLYYVRVAKALPQHFELCAMLCRSQEKADKMAEENGIVTTVSVDKCRAMQPDFVVVVVNKADICKVSMEWMSYGFTVLCETPAALTSEALERLWTLHMAGQRLVVAEQYTHYPQYQAMLRVLHANALIGEADCVNISLAHDYHGASLMRAMLGEPADAPFTVRAKTYGFPTVETLNRYERFTDGRIRDKNRTAAVFEFADGKVAWYDFDSEQYRSPIRKNYVKVQGCRGELKDQKIYFLDEQYAYREAELCVTWRQYITDSTNPNLYKVNEVEEIVLRRENAPDEVLYKPEFGLCGLAEDETAVAQMMRQAWEYTQSAKTGSGEEQMRRNGILVRQSVDLRNALQDAYMAILMRQAEESGLEVSGTKQIWQQDFDILKAYAAHTAERQEGTEYE